MLSEEAKMVAVNLKKTTSQLVRAFYRDEAMMFKLKNIVKDMVGKKAQTDLFTTLKLDELTKLWQIKLTTSLEEKMSMEEQVNRLNDRTEKLEKEYEAKTETYHKIVEEAHEKLEVRKNEIDKLKQELAAEQSDKKIQKNEIEKRSQDN